MSQKQKCSLFIFSVFQQALQYCRHCQYRQRCHWFSRIRCCHPYATHIQKKTHSTLKPVSTRCVICSPKHIWLNRIGPSYFHWYLIHWTSSQSLAYFTFIIQAHIYKTQLQRIFDSGHLLISSSGRCALTLTHYGYTGLSHCNVQFERKWWKWKKKKTPRAIRNFFHFHLMNGWRLIVEILN